MTEDSNFNTNEYPQENANMQEDEIQDEFALAKHSLKRKRIERKIRKKRKKVIDSVAATIILQTYLDMKGKEKDGK